LGGLGVGYWAPTTSANKMIREWPGALWVSLPNPYYVHCVISEGHIDYE
jgi:hypothetical protein